MVHTTFSGTSPLAIPYASTVFLDDVVDVSTNTEGRPTVDEDEDMEDDVNTTGKAVIAGDSDEEDN